MTPSTLSAHPGARLLYTLSHHALVPAVNSFLRAHKPVFALYLALNLVCIAVALFAARIPQPGWPLRLDYVVCGMAGAWIVLIPIHEAIHAAAYRFYGARDTRLHYRWRTLTAWCTADLFPLRGDRFLWVALAPFLVLSPLLAAPVFLFPKLAPFFAGALFLHTGACSGDFGMVAFIARHRPLRSLWTYDDNAQSATYFYALDPSHPDA